MRQSAFERRRPIHQLARHPLTGLPVRDRNHLECSGEALVVRTGPLFERRQALLRMRERLVGLELAALGQFQACRRGHDGVVAGELQRLEGGGAGGGMPLLLVEDGDQRHQRPGPLDPALADEHLLKRAARQRSVA